MRGRELSPLQEIERRVQQRAKEISLDVAGSGGTAKLRALIGDEVDAWNADYKRGLRDFDLADPEAVAERAYRNLVGYGPLEPLLGGSGRRGNGATETMTRRATGVGVGMGQVWGGVIG